MLGGAANWISQIATTANEAIQAGLIIFFAIFGLKVLVKRDWLVVLIGSLLLPLQENGVINSKQIWLDAPIYISIYGVILLTQIRFGLLTTVVGLFFINAISRFLPNNDFTAWYMPNTVAMMILLIGLSIFFFWRSLGDQKLIKGSA